MASFWKTNDEERIPCPNCGAPLLVNMKECPKCHYSLKEGMVKEKNPWSRIYLTTSSSIENYTIVSEYGISFGDAIVINDDLLALIGDKSKYSNNGMTGNTLDRLQDTRAVAMDALKESASVKGANAVVGVQFQTIHFPGFVQITAYGTAVTVVKKELKNAI